MTIRIVTGYSRDYTVSNLDEQIATEFVNSQPELRTVLKTMGVHPEQVESAIARLSRERLVEVSI